MWLYFTYHFDAVVLLDTVVLFKLTCWIILASNFIVFDGQGCFIYIDLLDNFSYLLYSVVFALSGKCLYENKTM